jgi:hypothetical protein
LSRYAGNDAAKPGPPDPDLSYYTVQFSAVRKAADRNKYKNLGNVSTSFGEDGYYRYSVGIYNNRQEAEIELNRIKSLGYTDAFLKKLESSK